MRKIQTAELCNRLVNNVLKHADLTWDNYIAKMPIEREELLKVVRNERWKLGPNESAMSHEQFLAAARQWINFCRLGTPLEAPIKAKHLVAVAKPADIDLLLEVKAAVLMRVSDEAYYEACEIDLVVQYLGRSRYRRDPDLTDKAEILE